MSSSPFLAYEKLSPAEDQSAIVINGCLHLFSHTVDVQTPILQAIYNPGDIIGNSQIDKGWSRDTHSWILAY